MISTFFPIVGSSWPEGTYRPTGTETFFYFLFIFLFSKLPMINNVCPVKEPE